MNTQVVIKKANESYVKIEASEKYIEIEIQDKFSFEIPNAQYDKRVINNKWDGIKRLYNRRTKLFPIGLVLKLLQFLKAQEYSYHIDPDLIPQSGIDMDDIKFVIEEVIDPHDNENPIFPYEHQMNAIHYMLNMGRTLCLSSTSSGKSLMIYCVLRILQLVPEMEGKRMFVVVPSAHLVEQMYSDFENYAKGSKVNWNVARHCQKVNKDYKKFIDKQIVITTWQSLSKLPRQVLDDMEAMFVDEVHGAKADVLSKIVVDSINCPIKHGLTGSLDGFESNEMFIEGLFGPRRVIMTAKESIDKGIATPVDINVLLLKYTDDYKNELANQLFEKDENGNKPKPKELYNIEKQFIYTIDKRLQFIKNLALSLEGNTLILVDSIDKYQIPLYESIKKEHEHTYFVNGNVDTSDRKQYIDFMESDGGKVIKVATYGTMSTGVSIKNLNNLILGSSIKSLIKIIQTIGRMMRKHKNKERAQIYDIVDDFSIGKYKGYMMKHAEKRIKIYSDEQHPVKFFPIHIK
ncbi:MAG: DEAD/DEAH box helicase [Nitrosopumilaceae archaeon]|nr:DEAD/DEAH box helicase [Nitrosopumilaceae archaeon]